MAVTLADAIVFFKGDDSKLSADMDTAKGKVGNFAGAATQLIGGAVVGAAAAAGAAILAIGKGALDVSMDTATAARDMAASLGLPIEEAEKFADVAKRVYGNNFADSVGDAATAVEALAKQLGMSADDPALQTMTENAFRLRDVFGVEVTESISAVKALTENFGISSEEAFDLLATGYQRGLDGSGDLLDTIGEYSVQFAENGASATEFFSAMDTGLQAGVLGTDKAADAFKEFGLRIKDGSTLTADSLAAIGLSAEDITTGLSNGTLTVKDVFDQVQAAMIGTEDPIARFNAGVGLLGSQYEDLGEKTILAMDLTDDWADGGLESISKLDVKYGSFGGAVEGMWRRLTVSVSPFTDKLLELVNEAMPSIMGAFDTFDKSVGPIMTGIGTTISTVVDAVKGYFGGFKSAIDTDGNGPLKFWKEWADTNLPLVKTLFENILGGLRTFWETWGPAIQLVVDTTFGNIWTVIDLTMRNIGSLITLALQLLTGDWEGAKTTLEGIVQRTWDAIYGIFSNTLGTIQTLISGIDWGELGRNIIEGIANGISGAVSRITEAARGAAQSAYNAAKSWLGIRSPSAKTEKEIGKPFVEGIRKGIENEIGSLTGSVNLGLQGLMGGIQQPAPAMAGGFNITVQVSGDNATYEGGRAVGRGIQDELRRRGY